jgi:uncharacterized surface protein with fasciclin (FAS1) repeats
MKKTNLLGRRIYAELLLVLLLTVAFVGCKDDLKDKIFTTSTGITMADYMKLAPDTFSTLYKVLEKTNGVSFLNAYGSYTFFAPTNAAFDDFFKSIGKASVADFTTNDDINLLKSIVKLHLCQDTISSDRFREGGLVDTTMSGDILTTEFGNGGINDVTVSRVAKIIRRDIQVVNGYIHVINKVLNPSDFSHPIYDKIALDPELSIFAEALLKTGLSDSVKQLTYIDKNGYTKPYSYTVFVEPNAVYNKKEINSYNDLLTRFSNTGNPYKNPQDSLYLLIANHLIRNSSPYFLRDFSNLNYQTMSYDYLSISLRDTFTLNTYFVVDKYLSNNVAKNGVFHIMDSMFVFKNVPPQPLYLDIYSNWTEVTSRTDLYKKKSINFPSTDYPNGLPEVRYGAINGSIGFYYSLQTFFINGDFFQVADIKKSQWFEFDLPAVNKGTYNLWICAKCQASRATADVLMDGKMVGRVNMNGTKNATLIKLNLDVKNYLKAKKDDQFFGLLAGTVTFDKTTTHVIRFQAVPNNSGPVTIDMIQLIPINMDQRSPLF